MWVSFQAGLAVIDEPITKEHMHDWRGMGQVFEDQIPNWPPGEGFGYHAITFGWLVDQLVRRVDPDSRSLGTFLKEEITDKYGIDFHVGTDKKLFYRVARHSPPTFGDLLEKLHNPGFLKFQYAIMTAPRDGLMAKVTKNPSWYMPDGAIATNDPEMLEIEVGAANGVGTARGLARILSLMGEKKIYKENSKIVQKIFSTHLPEQTCKVVRIPMTMGLGFMRTNGPTNTKQIGHPGYGGQNVKLDVDNDMAFAYITNGLTPDMGDTARNFLSLQTALYQSL